MVVEIVDAQEEVVEEKRDGVMDIQKPDLGTQLRQAQYQQQLQAVEVSFLGV